MRTEIVMFGGTKHYTMKTTLSFLLTGLYSIYFSTQLTGQATNDIKLAIDSDIQFASSSQDARKESNAGIGKLGVKYQQNYLYGGIHFTVFSQNDSIVSRSTMDKKTFGTNLLLPQNSNGSFSNFSFNIGMRSFSSYDDVDDDIDILSFKRIGANFDFNVNNTTWNNDSISLPVSIVSFNLCARYTLLNAEIMETNEKITATLYMGITGRRLGGDYGLQMNEQYRSSFTGTEKLGFNGFLFSTRLEISKFYGQINYTSFNRSQNITGFSGDQFLISIGLNADLNLPVKSVKSLKLQTL